MPIITDAAVPPTSLLGRLAAERNSFADAYRLMLPRSVSLAEFVEAFYTTRLFKLERWLIARTGRPSTDADIRALAQGEDRRMAAWTVEAREGDEMLMHEDSGVTRSWFKAEAGEGGTTLWFGSAFMPRRREEGGQPRFGWLFHALLGFHRAYSRALLGAAARRLG
ncbi:hypothetical protein [Roseateles sp.]|uniref:hypothetical protein n=1 Tax=Roseateles sp. TaxID=1971397 RepID=UPI003BABBEBD